jgi:hypothetical protein
MLSSVKFHVAKREVRMLLARTAGKEISKKKATIPLYLLLPFLLKLCGCRRQSVPE